MRWNPNGMRHGRHRLYAAMVVLLMLPALIGSRPPVQYSGKDADGRTVQIPAADKPTLLIFIRPDQPQSRQVIQQVQTILGDVAEVQTILVASVRETDGQLRPPAGTGWRVITDADYTLSGSAGVHVWPTTLLLSMEGEQKAHLAGLGKSFASSLRAYIDHELGRIDDVELERRLSARQVVTENHVAVRHLQLARQLLEKGRHEQGRAELEQAMTMLPPDSQAQLTAARLLLAVGQTKRAVELLEQMDPSSVPAWQMSLLLARAAIASEQWDRAELLLPAAIQLNPNPAEAEYLKGIVQAQRGQWQEAAESFRTAFEAIQPLHRIE